VVTALAVIQTLLELGRIPARKFGCCRVPCEGEFRSCQDGFKSCQNGAGFDHAPFLECGYASTTPGFHKDEKNRNQNAGKGSVAVVLKVMISVATLFGFFRPQGCFVEEAFRGCVTTGKCSGLRNSCREMRALSPPLGIHATYSLAVGNCFAKVSGRASVFVEQGIQDAFSPCRVA